MWFTKIALKRPVTVSMFFICAVVMGIASIRLLPLELMPEMEFPGVFITVNYPGSSPEEIERTITRPIEEVLATVSDINSMTSNSNENRSNVRLNFDWQTSAKLKAVEVREKLDAIRSDLPEDIQRIYVSTFSTSDESLVEIQVSADRDLADSWQLLDTTLRQRLERIPGVAQIDIQGVVPKTYQITLQAESLEAYHINTNDLLSRLQATNILISAGDLRNPQNNLRVAVNEQFKNIDDIRNFVVNKAGITLGDIAEVHYGASELTFARHLGRESAVGIQVSKESGANIVEASTLVLEEMERIQELPDFEGINLFVNMNSGEMILDSLKDISKSGIYGFFLSALVLFLFLRSVKMTLIVSLAVPFSLMITLAVLYLAGFTLNILSLMGLMLAIGMLVDNAVVVSESIFTYRAKEPDKPYQAALKGVKDVGIPVMAGTLTTAIVFLPNIIGEKIELTMFLSHVATSIVVALMASLFIAMTIIPLALSRLKVDGSKKPPVEKLTDSVTPVNSAEFNPSSQYPRYSRFLFGLIKRPFISTILVIGMAASVVIPASIVSTDQGDDNNSGQLRIFYNLNTDYDIDRVEQAVNSMEDFLFEHVEELDIDDVFSYFGSDNAGSILLLKDKEARKYSTLEIKTFIEENMPKFAIGDPSFTRSDSDNNEGFSLRLNGDDSRTLLDLSEEMVFALSGIKGVKQVIPDSQRGKQEVRVTLNAQRLEQLGLNPSTVAQMISTGMRKQQLRTYRNDQGEIDISISLFAENTDTSLDDLAALPVTLNDARSIRLDSIAEFNVVQALPTIRRLNRKTGSSIRLEYNDEITSTAEVREAAIKIMDQYEYPPGYGWSFGRGLEDFDQDINTMIFNMLMAVVMIFVVMAALFESLLFPIAVVTSILYGIVGVFWFFLLTGTNLTIMAMIGILVLIGVVVNNGIVLIDRINHYRQLNIDKYRAAVFAANDRVRPILMTAATTILGLLPLALGDSTVAGAGEGPAYYPMARAVIGGLAYSTCATLICLPAIYLFLDWLRSFYGKLWHASAQKEGKFYLYKGRLLSKNIKG